MSGKENRNCDSDCNVSVDRKFTTVKDAETFLRELKTEECKRVCLKDCSNLSSQVFAFLPRTVRDIHLENLDLIDSSFAQHLSGFESLNSLTIIKSRKFTDQMLESVISLYSSTLTNLYFKTM